MSYYIFCGLVAIKFDYEKRFERQKYNQLIAI